MQKLEGVSKNQASKTGVFNGALSLDNLYKNNYTFKYKFGFNQCERKVGYFEGIFLDKDNSLRLIKGNLPCNSWQCSVCRPKKLAKLKRRMNNGSIKNYKKSGFRAQYHSKLLTLTCPGKDFRSNSTGIVAYEKMSKAFNDLVTKITKKFGKFTYFKVQELHRDGFPHFHVLMVGESIASKEILPFVRHLWCEVHGLGNIDIKVIKNLRHSINYLLKYLSKEVRAVGENKKIFTASKGALGDLKRDGRWLKTAFIIGDAFQENDIIHEKIIYLKSGDVEEIIDVIINQLHFFDVIKLQDLLAESGVDYVVLERTDN